MLAKFLIFWLARSPVSGKQKSTAGFTILEILAAMMVVTTVIVTVLGLVVDLVSTNQRETAQTETQQEMQRAIDYMSSEMREAVYIYDGNCLALTSDSGCQNGVFSHVRIPEDSVPILAFWKLKPLPQTCEDDECDRLRIGGRSYALVVYFLSKANPDTWQGKARITRYELNKFDSDGNLVAGYVDPSEITFATWPGANPPGQPDVQTDVLVDFVDDTYQEAVGCDPGYALTPPNSLLTGDFAGVRSFYACVRTGEGSGFNQDAIIFLRGNATGKAGLNNENFLPVLKTQVLRRGVFEKEPQ